MTDNVIPFSPQVVGDGYKVDPHIMLDAARENDFTELVIVGIMPDGEIYLASSNGIPNAVYLLEVAKSRLID